MAKSTVVSAEPAGAQCAGGLHGVSVPQGPEGWTSYTRVVRVGTLPVSQMPLELLNGLLPSVSMAQGGLPASTHLSCNVSPF